MYVGFFLVWFFVFVFYKRSLFYAVWLFPKPNLLDCHKKCSVCTYTCNFTYCQERETNRHFNINILKALKRQNFYLVIFFMLLSKNKKVKASTVSLTRCCSDFTLCCGQTRRPLFQRRILMKNKVFIYFV